MQTSRARRRLPSLVHYGLSLALSLAIGPGHAHLPQSPSPEVLAARNSIDAGRMSDLVHELSSRRYLGRLPGTEGDKRARAYLENLFRQIGLAPAGTNGFLQEFNTQITQPDGESHGNPRNPLMGRSARTANIIGSLPGTDPKLKHEIIIISGHHDHLGWRPRDEDADDDSPVEYYPGANDDLSGIASMLELARAFKRLKGPQNRRTLMFVAYGAEEQTEMGSTAHVKKLRDEGSLGQVILMLSIDMIGRGYKQFDETLAATWARQAYRGEPDDGDMYSHKYECEPGPTFDYDAGPFAHHGINNRVIGRADVDHYHKPSDTAKTVEFEAAARVTKAIFDFVWHIDQADIPPKPAGIPAKCRK